MREMSIPDIDGTNLTRFALGVPFAPGMDDSRRSADVMVAGLVVNFIWLEKFELLDLCCREILDGLIVV